MARSFLVLFSPGSNRKAHVKHLGKCLRSMRSASDLMLSTRGNNAHDGAEAARRLQSHLRYGNRLLIESTEFPPIRRHATRESTAGQKRGEDKVNLRFPAALSGLGSATVPQVCAVSLSEVGALRINLRTGTRVGLVAASRTSRANGDINITPPHETPPLQTARFCQDFTCLLTLHFTSSREQVSSFLFWINLQSCFWLCSSPRGRYWRYRSSSSSSRT